MNIVELEVGHQRPKAKWINELCNTNGQYTYIGHLAIEIPINSNLFASILFVCGIVTNPLLLFTDIINKQLYQQRVAILCLDTSCTLSNGRY